MNKNTCIDEKKEIITGSASFEKYRSKIIDLLRQTAAIPSYSITQFHQFLKDALSALKEDVYLTTPHEKATFFSKLPEAIWNYFEKSKYDPKVATLIILVLSQNHIEVKFDKIWLFEEKELLFNDTVIKIGMKFCEILEKDVSCTISMNLIAKVTQGLALWTKLPPASVVEDLVRHMENRFNIKKTVYSSVAFQFIDGLVYLKNIMKNNPARSETIAQLAEAALPLLLNDDPPLVMHFSKYLTLNRISDLKSLLPQPDCKLYAHFSFQFLKGRLNQETPITRHMIDSSIPDHVIPHKKLSLALEAKESALLSETPSQLSILQIYIRFIKHLHRQQNPRALQWVVTCYSQHIVDEFKRGRNTHSLQDIQTYLKLMRRCLLSIDVKPIETAIQKLSQAVLRNSYFAGINSSSAIDLLWINLVLSFANKNLGYSLAEQAMLFKKITETKINTGEAHALYEIKALRYHGEVPFTITLLQQMEIQLKDFLSSVNPSTQEKKLYSILHHSLPSYLRIYLRANFICEETGHEIDIAYYRQTEKQKIAIHVDGPFHFDAVTGFPTLKTRFRNRCLAAAGWTSLDINITKPFDITKITTELNKLIVGCSRNTTIESSSSTRMSKARSHSISPPVAGHLPRQRAASWPRLFVDKQALSNLDKAAFPLL